MIDAETPLRSRFALLELPEPFLLASHVIYRAIDHTAGSGLRLHRAAFREQTGEKLLERSVFGGFR
jgi:hypothetical protein